ncbi:MAG TPA: molybdopterin-guanine dinucleotide biosynthesis protein B, partial [bacterium]|nr:molybdopterin-guanine dinucleotide biosynthesis protein B [bacterium]
ALRAMLGYAEAIRPAVAARLAAPLRIKPGRRRYLWGRAMLGPDGLVVTPQSVQGTAAIRPASEANALIVIDAHSTDLPRGSAVDVLLLARGPLPLAADGRPAVLGVVGARGAGKTALIERLIPALARRGITAAFVKHHAHQQTLDISGTDTSRAGAAGALRTVLAGPGGITVRTAADYDPALAEVLAHVGGADLIMVEGYSQSGIPAILVHRAEVESDRMPPLGPVIAVAGDPGAEGSGRHFAWDAVDGLADFLIDHFRLPASSQRVRAD